jgi:iron complex outermembrane recepter protein
MKPTVPTVIDPTYLIRGGGFFMRTLLAAAVACMTIVGLSHADDSQASIRKTFNIPAQGLGAALQALSREQDVHVVFMLEDVDRLNTRGVNGEMTVDEALGRLLEGTGLRYEHVDSQTVTIVPMATGPAVKGKDDTASVGKEAQESRGFWDRFRMAQAAAGETGVKEEEESAKLEEVVVTAQRRAEQVQDVPLAISVLSGDDLDTSSQSVIEQLNRVPGVSTQDSTLGGKQIIVRGVNGADLFVGTSTTGYYLDSIPFGFIRHGIAPDANAFDLDHVEVLRGPQGTLYGVSALNGVVRVLTKEPDFDESELKLRSYYSTTEQGSGNYRGDVAANIPLIPGKLAARGVVGYESLSGWIDGPNAKDINDSKNENVRLKINWRPTDKLLLGVFGWRNRDDFGARPLARSDMTTGIRIPEPSASDYDVYGLKLGYEFDSFVLSSSSSHIDFKGHSTVTLGGANIIPLVNRFESEVLSQEVTLASSGEGPWRWTAGGIYRDVEDITAQNLPGSGFPSFGNPVGSIYMDFSKSYAIFGELTRSFSDGRWELTGGLRYFEDDAEMQQIANPLSASAPLFSGNGKYDALTPRAVLTWRPNERVMSYASYGQGFRSGFAQSPFVLALVSFPDVEPDKLSNYELGIKGSSLDRRFSYDAAVFYTTWKDLQQNLVVATPLLPTGIGVSINAADASGIGAEFAVNFRPISALDLGLSYGWNDLAFDDNVTTLAGTPPVPRVTFPKGGRLTGSPEHTASASADYRFAVGAKYTAEISTSATYTSAYTFNSIVGSTTGEEVLISRLSFGLAAPFGLTTTLFIDNVGNESPGHLRLLPTRGPAGVEGSGRSRPRTIGLQLEYRL